MSKKIHRNALKEGHKVQWYVIRHILGQGGFGITYLAYDLNLNKEFAIKEYLPIEIAVREGDHSVHPATTDNENAYETGLKNFINEARTLSNFSHPNIVKIYTVFEENNTAYMVMEFEQGRTLQEILKNRKVMEETRLLNILTPLIGAINYLHNANYIHRDIKPDNILIRDSGDPVLIDFGAARQTLVDKALTTIVTPGYAPIEQYQPDQNQQGAWTDIYSLGATLYRATCGMPPADSIDRSNALAKGLKDPYIPSIEVANKDNYSSRLLKAIDHALCFDDKKRPRTIDDWYSEFLNGKEEIKAENNQVKIYRIISVISILLVIGIILYFTNEKEKEKDKTDSAPEVVYIFENELRGLWDTTYGVLEFEKVGKNSFYGKYSYGDGKLYGNFINNKLSGLYTENEDSQKCKTMKHDSYYWGTFEFEYNNNLTEFEGYWGMCTLLRESEWTGKKVRDY